MAQYVKNWNKYCYFYNFLQTFILAIIAIASKINILKVAVNTSCGILKMHKIFSPMCDRSIGFKIVINQLNNRDLDRACGTKSGQILLNRVTDASILNIYIKYRLKLIEKELGHTFELNVTF